jgi:hypothetical protein
VTEAEISRELHDPFPRSRRFPRITTRYWPNGGANDGSSGHKEGRFLLDTNSTGGRPFRRRVRISSKIYLVVVVRPLAYEQIKVIQGVLRVTLPKDAEAQNTVKAG